MRHCTSIGDAGKAWFILMALISVIPSNLVAKLKFHLSRLLHCRFLWHHKNDLHFSLFPVPHFAEITTLLRGWYCYPWLSCYCQVVILGLTVIGWFCMLKPQEWCEEVQYLKLIMHFPKKNVKLRRCSVSWWNMIHSTSPLGLYSLSCGHGTWDMLKIWQFPPQACEPWCSLA